MERIFSCIFYVKRETDGISEVNKYLTSYHVLHWCQVLVHGVEEHLYNKQLCSNKTAYAPMHSSIY